MKKLIQIFKFCSKLNVVKSIYYSLRFNGHIFIGKGNIYIEGNGKIEFLSKKSSLYVGVYTTVQTPTVITIMNNAKLIVGQNVMIHRGTKIVVHENGSLKINDYTYINENSRVHCKKCISIGKRCAISWNTNILDTDIHTIQYSEEGKNNHDYRVNIGNEVWIGANSTVLKGTIIEDNCIVAANSLAMGRLKSRYIYGGNPCKELKTFEIWSL